MTSFSYDHVLSKATEYFEGDSLAATVWAQKYALRLGNEFYEETPRDMHARIATELHRIEAKYPNPVLYDEIFASLDGFHRIVPQGSPMTGIGNNLQLLSLSNCFVVGNKHDSYGGIFLTDQQQVQLMKRRGGVGHDISHLRPENTSTSNAAGTSSGAPSYMHRYSNSTREVAQKGRRGALMLSIHIKHPDSPQFIKIKNDNTSVTGANISVKVSDEFMTAVENEAPFTLQYPVDVPENEATVVQIINAKELWDSIIYNAWDRAEPGVLYWDKIISESIPDCYAAFGFETTSTNPCGEIPLCPYDSCRLLLLNLFSYVDNPFSPTSTFNVDRFANDVQLAMRYMDDIVDLESEKIHAILDKIARDPEPYHVKEVELELWNEILKKCVDGRRTGLGITAEGDMLAALGLKYGTKEATDFAVEVHKILAVNAYYSSTILAKERGAFPIYNAELEKDNPFLNRVLDAADEYMGTAGLRELMATYGRRNIAILTIAPAGSMSMLTQTTSGIEPAFMVYYTRRTKVNPGDPKSRVDFIDEVGDCWMENKVFHHKFRNWYSEYCKGFDDGVARVEFDLDSLSTAEIDELVAVSPWSGATANDVDWAEKVSMQGRIQQWVDHSISVTVNIPNSATQELVDTIYRTGWKAGCKGMTVYRDGCRSGVLVTEETLKKQKGETVFEDNHAPKRPKVLPAKVVRFQNNYDTWIAFVGLLEGKPYEIFTGKTNRTMRVPTNQEGEIVKTKDDEGKGKYDFRWIDEEGNVNWLYDIHRLVELEYYNYGKLISGILRHGMPIPYIVEVIGELHFSEDHINTWKNGILRGLKQFVPDGVKAVDAKCPECGDPEGLVFASGCVTCKSCGHSKCG